MNQNPNAGEPICSSAEHCLIYPARTLVLSIMKNGKLAAHPVRSNARGPLLRHATDKARPLLLGNVVCHHANIAARRCVPDPAR